MRPNDISIYYRDKSPVGKSSYRPPECGLATTWHNCHRGRFRVNLTIIGPKAEEIKGDFTATSGKVQRVRQAISDLVETLEEELG